MANNKNLKRGNPETQFKSGQKAVESGRKGGIASGIAKRRKRTEKELAMMILDAAVSDDDDRHELESFGIEGEDATYYALMLARLIQKALNGDVQAIKEYRNIIETDNAAKDIELRKQEAKRRDKELEMKVEKFEEDNW